ncbi:CDP-archaeol synthase [Enterococcus sp. LJL128]
MVVVLQMYITLMPVILAGILNMVWCKSSILKNAAVPIDQGKVLKDGQRLFGENKTWKGFGGYLLWGSVSGLVWGWFNQLLPYLEAHNFLYTYHANQVPYNLLMGLAFGAAYAICELPNSFLKRRAGIRPGKPAKGQVQLLFFLLDQIDSLLGCVWVLTLVYPMSAAFYSLFVILGGLTHIGINVILYKLHLRKNIF